MLDKIIRVLLLILLIVICVNIGVVNFRMSQAESKYIVLETQFQVMESGLDTVEKLVVPSSRMIRSVLPSTVTITVFNPGIFDIFTGKMDGCQGSGVVVDDKGTILTCKHVVDRLQKDDAVGSVTFYDGSVRAIKRFAFPSDKNLDLAICQVEPNGLMFHPASFLKLSVISISDPIWLIGAGGGYTFSVTHGVISKIAPSGSGGADLQVDAVMNPGVSGGPAFDRNGEVVGIAQSIVSPGSFNTGIGFLIGVEKIYKYLPEMKAELYK